MILFNETAEFKSDFKGLHKRYRSLSEDFNHLCCALRVSAIPTDKHSAIIIDQSIFQIIKIRMACKSLRNSSLRVIYSYYKEKQQIEFIQIYFKGDNANENRERIKKYIIANKN